MGQPNRCFAEVKLKEEFFWRKGKTYDEPTGQRWQMSNEILPHKVGE